MNDSQFLALIGMLSAAYPRTDLPEQTIQVYRLFLQGEDAELMLKAALMHIASSRFFPTIQELLSAAQKVKEHANGIDDSPYAAWSQVIQAIRQGYGRDACVDDIPGLSPAARLAAQRVGWKDICMSSSIGVERAHFVAAYNEIQARNREDALIELIEPAYRQAAALVGGGNPNLITEGGEIENDEA